MPRDNKRQAAAAGLRDEQRALLQLLLKYGQSYDDLAELFQHDRSDLRAAAHDALLRLTGDRLDGDASVCDYLLGQADPIERAEAVRFLRSDPDALDRVEEAALKLRLLAPEASLPKLPRRRRAARQPMAGPVADPAPVTGAKGASAEPGESPTRDALYRGLRSVADGVRRLRERSSTRTQRVVAITATGLVMLVVGSQLIAPSVLEARLKGQLEQLGAVENVEVGAFPAVETLWGGMDSLEVELGAVDASALGSSALGSADRGEMLERLESADNVQISAESVTAGPAALEGVDVTKSGDALEANFTVDPESLKDALPLGEGIEVEVIADGGSLQLLLTGGPFGDQEQRMTVAAQDGELVGLLELDQAGARELGVPAGMSPPPQPLFGNEQLRFDELTAEPDGAEIALHLEGHIASEGEVRSVSSPFAPASPGESGGGLAPSDTPAAPETPPTDPAPPSDSSAPAGGLPQELVDCLAEQGVELPPGGGLPAGVDPTQIQAAVQACAQHLPQGAMP